MTYKILLGNNLDILPTLPDNSVDSIVTDPPYELGFMGKKWDSSGIAYSVELWQQCLRVLKPGGHLLSFGGTRTWHRVAVGIEDAGFEIRDSMAWLYGSGFPKSLDISKAIDKAGGSPGFKVRDEITKLLISTKITDAEIANHVGVARQLVGAWRNGLSLISEGQATRLKELLDCEIPREAERAIVGKASHHSEGRKKFTNEYVGGSPIQGTVDERIITAPSTPEAQQWQGWGTALKPAFEPIVVARKPIEGTVANNVLKWGTGGLNIDGSRIGTQQGEQFSGGHAKTRSQTYGSYNLDDKALAKKQERIKQTIEKAQTLGRWPANIILDPYTAELLDEQSGQVRSNHNKTNDNSGFGDSYVGGSLTRPVSGPMYSDKGGASRFFYVAKASKRDRNEGLDELDDSGQHKWNGSVGHRGVGDYYPDGTPRPVNPMKNFHPTVKPTTLMEYLIKLVTPPGGVVLDPFTGSGSTGKAAILQGFDFIGIEMTEEYLPIIEGRLKHAEQLVAEAKEQDKLKENEVLF